MNETVNGNTCDSVLQPLGHVISDLVKDATSETFTLWLSELAYEWDS